MVKIFAHTDKTVRAEVREPEPTHRAVSADTGLTFSQGTILAQALHLFLGPGLTPHLNELKDIQQKELTEKFAAMDAAGQTGGSGRPTRFTRREQAQRQQAEVAGGDGEAEAGGKVCCVQQRV